MAVWVVLARPCDWRWGQDGERSAFDPTARLFRQRRAGDWSGAIDELAAVLEGTGKTWTADHNERWLKETRPIIEAFFHARYMLEMAVGYGRDLERPPSVLPSGWAALLYLFGFR